MALDRPVPAVLCIDVEPDDFVVPMPDPEPRWRGFEALLPQIDDVRARLASSSGRPCALTWFLRMDPQVAIAYGGARFIVDRYRADLARLDAAGDELGLHTHPFRWQDGLGWVQDFADPEHTADCVRTSLAAYRDAFGRSCRAYRHGARFMSRELGSLLVDNGLRVDLTFEPGPPALSGLANLHVRGLIPHVPRDLVAPQVANPDNVFEPGQSELLVIPLTNSVLITANLGSGTPVPFSTMVLWLPPREFAAMLEARLTDSNLTHLAFAIRTDLPLHAVEWSWFQANIDHLCAHPIGAEVAWVTASDARELLLPRAAAARGAPRWPDDSAAAVALSALAASLGRGLRDVERELADERGRHAVDVEALRAAEAGGVDLERRLARAEAHLAEVRATTWWRLHDRLLPVLAPLSRIRRL